MSVRTSLARRGVACAAMVAAMVVGAATAAADRKPVLIVDGTTDGSGAEAVSALEARLAVEDRLGGVAADVSEAMRRPVVADTSWQGELTTALAEVRAELARFGYQEAAERARDALDRLARAADVPAARAQLAELALLEGQALVGAGELDRAEVTLRLVHRLDPGRRLDPARYLPEIVAAFVAAARPPTGTATLRVSALGADELLVDGAVVGRGESRIVDVEVAPGPHLVSARGEEVITVGRRVDAPPGQAIRVELVPSVAPFPVLVQRVMTRLRAAPDDDALRLAVDDLRRLARVADAVVVVRGEAGVATRIFTERGGLRPARPFADAEATVAPLRPLVPRPPPPPPLPPPPFVPWYDRTEGRIGIITGISVVVAAAVAAMVLRDPGSSTFAGRPTTR